MDHVRILIAEGHELVCTAITRVLNDEPEFDVIGHASNRVEAVAPARGLRPDVVVVDVCTPRMDGINAPPGYPILPHQPPPSSRSACVV